MYSSICDEPIAGLEAREAANMKHLHASQGRKIWSQKWLESHSSYWMHSRVFGVQWKQVTSHF